MKTNIQDKGKSGIYMITNNINNKVYIGKAKCIYKRIKAHITFLNTKRRKLENDHLINAWHKYGRENFNYKVLEYLELNDKLLSERELYYFKLYNCLDPNIGYNIRCDSSTGLIVSEATRKKLSIAQIKRFKDPKEREKVSHTFWKDNPDKLLQMIAKVSKLITIYKIYQYDKSMNLIKIWDTVRELVLENPSYKKHNIYAVCSGEKPSMYGFIWKKILINDIVQK